MPTPLDDFLATIPIDQLATQLGVSEAEADQALRQAAPAILAGMQANAADPAGAASLERALGQHSGSLLDAFDLGGVDTDDGARIVRNVFGANEQQVVDQLSGAQGLSSGTLVKLLPMLAPLVMAFLAKMTSGGATAPSAGSGSASGTGFPGPGSRGSADAPSGDGGSGGLGDILGGGGLGDVLGGLLGGGGGGGLGDVLGGLLGGGKR